jgi:chorismate mutase/prephenate dehydratase
MARRTQPKAARVEVCGLDALRTRIDELDVRLVALINQRAEVAREIGHLKARNGEKAYAPAREIEVYRRVSSLNKGPLPDDAFRAIYREIMSGTIALERRTRVAFFGQPGTFTHLAATTKFGSSVEYLPSRDIRDVFMTVARGQADFGIVPVENSTEGGVNQSVDHLGETRLKVVSEIYLPIHHHLLACCAPKEIRVLYSHPQPFAQCRIWLTGHMAEIELKEVGSTADAAIRAKKTRCAGAIAGVLASKLYGVPIRVANIEDQPDNITRFFVIGEKMSPPSGHDKTSLVVSVKDQSGALLNLLKPFQDHRINLTRIESRPSKRRAWDYVFFIDLEGHIRDPKVEAALKEIESQVRHVEVLGSYPQAPRLPGPEMRSGVMKGKVRA